MEFGGWQVLGFRDSGLGGYPPQTNMASDKRYSKDHSPPAIGFRV